MEAKFGVHAQNAKVLFHVACSRCVHFKVSSPMEANSLVRRPNIFARNYVFILAAVAALNNCNLGYDMGIVAGVGPILLKQNQFSVSEVQLELFIGVLDVSSLIGAASSNYLADKFGRKGCMALSELLFIFSVIGMACAQNYATLVAFRCVCGVGVGLGLTIGPLYVGELAPSAVRGKLVSWSELATNIGLLTAFVVGALAASLPEHLSWRLMLGLGAVLPTVLLCSLYCMPESPRWLILHGKVFSQTHLLAITAPASKYDVLPEVAKHVTAVMSLQVEEARGVLQRIHPPGADTDARVQDIQQTLTEESATYAQGGWHAIFCPTHAVYRALLAGVGIAAIQQLSGIEALTSYFVFIFQRAGLKASDAFLFLILFGVSKLVTVYIASRYFDDPNCGRRKLLLTSGIGVFLSMFVFAWVFSFPISPASQAIAVVTMFWYVIAYSVGYGPGAWVVMLEVLPMQIRGDQPQQEELKDAEVDADCAAGGEGAPGGWEDENVDDAVRNPVQLSSHGRMYSSVQPQEAKEETKSDTVAK
jgi:MFS family permease